MRVELPAWGVFAGVVLLGAALAFVPKLWMDRGAAEARLEALADSSEASSARADSAFDRLELLRDSLEATEDSLREVHDTLEVALEESRTEIRTTVDTIRAHLPPSERGLIDLLTAQLDTLEARAERQEATWQERFRNQQRQIAELEAQVDRERAARRAAEDAFAEAHDQLNPPVWKFAARNLPEAGAKVAGGYLACERGLETCAAYVTALGIDFIFDI